MLTKIVILSSTAISIDLTESLSQSSENQCHLLYSHLSQSLIFTAISYESFDIVHACGSWNLSNSNYLLNDSFSKKANIEIGSLVRRRSARLFHIRFMNGWHYCIPWSVYINTTGKSQLISTYEVSLLSILKCVTYWSSFAWIDSFFRKCQSQLCRVLHPK